MENHILVEKSITLNSDELNEMAKLADKNHVIIGEAMTIYHMPIYKKVKRNSGNRRIRKSKSYYNEFWKFQRIRYE